MPWRSARTDNFLARVRPLLISVLCAIALALPSIPAFSAPMIQWEVTNRFPFFPKDEIFRAILNVYRGLPLQDRQASPVLALERTLETLADNRGLDPAVFGDPSRARKSGWTSGLIDSTCFNEAGRSHRGCRLANGEDFLDQHTTSITVSLQDAPANKSCEWALDGVVQPGRDCSGSFSLPGVKLGTPFSLSVKIDGGEVARLDQQEAKSLLIVGMGDSFASGEGNPDRPVDFMSASTDYSQSSPFETSGWPRTYRAFPLSIGTIVDPHNGSLGVKARWLSEQCHRSLYSHQFRASLQIALEQPHVTVTYLGYACSGAEVYEGLLGPWKGRDDAARGRDDSPQIVRALRDLCIDPTPYAASAGSSTAKTPPPIKPCARLRKPVDALLLSIGGNDVGFSSVIAYEAVNSSRQPWLPFLSGTRFKLWRAAVKPVPFETAESKEPLLGKRLTDLGKSLRAAMQVQADKVIQTGYPHLLKTRSGACPKGNAGMDVHAIFAIRASTGPRSLPFLARLNEVLKKDSPFTVVDDFADGFAGHSLCDAGTENGPDKADGMVFPTYDFQRRVWKPLDPTQWQAYLPRARWFVTPNDAFLTGHYMRTQSGDGGDPNPQGPVQPVLAATLSGSFHPNALGQAAIGDGVVRQLRANLHLQQPSEDSMPIPPARPSP